MVQNFLILFNKFLLTTLGILFLHPQFIQAEDQYQEEIQKFNEFKKYQEFQKFLEMQKLHEKQKSPELEFLDNGFNIKHYQAAKKLNLDLNNYKIYHQNKKNKKRGFIFLGSAVATGITGMIFFYDIGSIESDENKRNSYYIDDDFKKDYIITGATLTAASIGLATAGIIRFLKLKEVYTKNGTQLSLLPKVDILNDGYRIDLSLSF